MLFLPAVPARPGEGVRRRRLGLEAEPRKTRKARTRRARSGERSTTRTFVRFVFFVVPLTYRRSRLPTGRACLEDQCIAETLHAHLIGRQGSRAVAEHAGAGARRRGAGPQHRRDGGVRRAHGLKLRPHAKTHKSVDIARRQIAAGRARGLLRQARRGRGAGRGRDRGPADHLAGGRRAGGGAAGRAGGRGRRR